jgi:membrane protein implicated in regulation of membrane protease activity
MSLIPSIELDGASGFLLILAVVGMVVLWFYATAVLSFALGAVLFILALFALYYALVRVDKFLRNGRRRAKP